MKSCVKLLPGVVGGFLLALVLGQGAAQKTETQPLFQRYVKLPDSTIPGDATLYVFDTATGQHWSYDPKLKWRCFVPSINKTE